MATSKEYLNFVLDGLSLLDGITYRQMMGEYIIYYREKIAAYVCNNRFLVKPVKAAAALLPDAALEAPYDGAKKMLIVENIEDKEFLFTLFNSMYNELSLPKKKR